ncbi:tetratricopeptide repeat-containing S1 family peptidase [Synechococcus sp. Minos11]|uniref:tetratricopeptide repeat-containing S1 family peptidase n=1 Tax=Synechococcus sp. Minos11 TaxID=221341 RepID=UPI001644285F|nr:serine protease [Synechococcus sp. Minos11]
MASPEVAKKAKGLTVRIEGATQGSGVLVEKRGSVYTVLTAWHVLSSNRPGEEITIVTSDGKSHNKQQGTVKRIGSYDLATLKFKSSTSYKLPVIGSSSDVRSGEKVFVSGYPLATSAVPTSIWRFLEGKVIANATGIGIPGGYQLLYSNQTLPGMSGGAVMNSAGQLVGIHGQGEVDTKMTQQQGVVVKTGTNQGIPISYFKSSSQQLSTTATTLSSSDFLAKAVSLLNIPGPYTGGSGGFRYPSNGYEKEVIQLTTRALQENPQNSNAYRIRAAATFRLQPESFNRFARKSREWRKAFDSGKPTNNMDTGYSDHQSWGSQTNWGRLNQQTRAIDALSDLKLAHVFDPSSIDTSRTMRDIYSEIGDDQRAIEYSLKILASSPFNAEDWSVIGNQYLALNQRSNACDAFHKGANYGSIGSIMQLLGFFDGKGLRQQCRTYSYNWDQPRLAEIFENMNQRIKQLSQSTNRKDKYEYHLARYNRGALKLITSTRGTPCEDLSYANKNGVFIKYRAMPNSFSECS